MGKVLDQQSLSRSLGLTPALPVEELAEGGVGTFGGQRLPSSGKSRVEGLAEGGVGTFGGQRLPSSGNSRVDGQADLQQQGSIILHHSKGKAKLFLLFKSPLLSAGGSCFGSCGPQEWLLPSEGARGRKAMLRWTCSPAQ